MVTFHSSWNLKSANVEKGMDLGSILWNKSFLAFAIEYLLE